MASVVGRSFGRWTALAPVKCGYIRCRCECGVEKPVSAANLYSGQTTQCRACGRRSAAQTRTTHGQSKSKLFRRWWHMVERCHSESSPGFSNYGARGIYVCDRWRESFEAFYADVGDPPSPHHSLDRIDNNGPYSPENVRWATRTEQARNTRRNRLLTYNGRTMTEVEWAEELGISRQALDHRLDAGWSLERALTEPKQLQQSLPKPERRPRPTHYICSGCGARGHNRRTCAKSEAA